MKKITKQDQELDPIQRELEEINIVDYEMEPPSKVLDYNLKKLKSFKAIRKKYKQSNQALMFTSAISELLKVYVPKNHQFDQDLLITVLNIAEEFFIFGNKEEREDIKRGAVKALMKPYFRDDDELLDIMIMNVWGRVKKTSLRRRLWKRLKNFFFKPKQ